MTVLPRAEYVAERMDAPGVDPEALAGAFDHVAAVNRWLGARRALLRHLPDALGTAATTPRVLDVGTGSADLPVALAEYATRHGRPLEITALDLHHGAVLAASERTAHLAAISILRSDGLRLPFRSGAFDLAIASMTLHHLDGPDPVRLLRELGRVARGGCVMVGELERSVPHYLGARLLAATLWRSNPVTRHDGPVSVLRAFTPRELGRLALRGGLSRPRVYRHFFYRLVLLADAR